MLYKEESGIEAFDAPAAGGDHFDLALLPDSPAARLIAERGARYVKLTAAAATINPDTGVAFPSASSFPGYADIDGVYGRHFASTEADGD